MNIDYILQNHGIGGYQKRDKTPPPPISDLDAEIGDSQVLLTWKNPIDTDFAGVKIVRKVGSYPENATDGVLIYAGANTSYLDATVVNGTVYYYRAVAYDFDNNYNDTIDGQQTIGKPRVEVIYGVRIDTTNSNPETAVTYIDMSTGFTPANGNNGNFQYGSWQNKFPFNQIKPCLFKDGVVNYYLNPNDFTQKLDGSPSDITTGADGNVMIEFPKVYWKFERIGTDLYIKYSDTKIDSGYKCLAHMRGAVEKDKCYIGAYMGAGNSSTPTKSLSLISYGGYEGSVLNDVRLGAQRNGSGYDLIAYHQLLMLQLLYVVMFKNLDSQTALGRGYTDGNASHAPIGSTAKKGMFFGETTGKLQMKFCGIEDFWGNYHCHIDGIYSDPNRNVFIGNESFNNSGTGYTNYGIAAAINTSEYIKDIQGTTELGFMVKTTTGGSTSTFYADFGRIEGYKLATFGEHRNSANLSGAFSLSVNNVTSDQFKTAAVGRLMYL